MHDYIVISLYSDERIFASKSHSTVCISWIIIPDILFMTIMSGIFRHDEIPFPAITRKCDWPQNPAMSSPSPANQTQSYANLAQRLLQVGCIISSSFLRLITSDNDTASIMESMCVSTSSAIIGNRLGSSLIIYYTQRCTLWDYTMSETLRHWQGIGW